MSDGPRAGVKSFQEAQALVPFPVVALDPSPLEIQVCPESRDRWATVWSRHNVGGATLRVKQFVYDWSDVSGLPTNIAHGWGKFYSPPEVFPVGSRPAFLGTDYKDHAAGFLSYLLVQIEVSNLTNSQHAPIRALLETVRPAVEVAARSLAARPIPLWSWIMRSGGRAWPKQGPSFARMRWFVDLKEARSVPGLVGVVPSAGGFQFDSVGTTIPSAENHPATCWLLRTNDLHACLALWTEPAQGRRRPMNHPKREDFPEYWEGEVGGLNVQHFYNGVSGFGLVFTPGGHGVCYTILPASLNPDPATDRERSVILLKAITNPDGP
jgi:hypothetical protein